jgi:arachidonate 15-lipoxygenase
MNFLGSIHQTTLGDYEDNFKNTPVADGLRDFRLDLSTTEDEIAQRNRRRPQAYEYLRPSLVPNSTNI